MITPPVNYAVVLFPGFQALDAFGPLDALNLVARDHKIDISIIGPSLGPVSTIPRSGNPSGSGFGQSVVPTHTYANPPENIDLLLIPGGGGVADPETVAPVIELVKKVHSRSQYVFSVCTGSRVLARAGILDGKRATTNKVRYKVVSEENPQVNWVKKARWVVDGNIWTSSGVSAGIDAMLAFLEEAYGPEVVKRVTTIMEYSRADNADDDPFSYVADEGLP